MLRLACRLCLEIGQDDPERWLATRPRRVVHLWAAYWRLEPWGLPWHRTAMQMCKLDQIAEMIHAWFGSQKPYRKAQFDDWMPGDFAGERKPRSGNMLRRQLKVLARRYGGDYP